MFINLTAKIKLDTGVYEALSNTTNGTGVSNNMLYLTLFNVNNPKSTINNALYGAGTTSSTLFYQNTPWKTSVKFHISLNNINENSVIKEIGRRLSYQGLNWRISNIGPALGWGPINSTSSYAGSQPPIKRYYLPNLNYTLFFEPEFGTLLRVQGEGVQSNLPTSITSWQLLRQPTGYIDYKVLPYTYYINSPTSSSISGNPYNQFFPGCRNDAESYIWYHNNYTAYFVQGVSSEIITIGQVNPNRIKMVRATSTGSVYELNYYSSSYLALYISCQPNNTQYSAFKYKTNSIIQASGMTLDDMYIVQTNNSGYDRICYTGHTSSTFYIYELEITCNTYYPTAVSDFIIETNRLIASYSILNSGSTSNTTTPALRLVVNKNRIYFVPEGYYKTNLIRTMSLTEFIAKDTPTTWSNYTWTISNYWGEVTGIYSSYSGTIAYMAIETSTGQTANHYTRIPINISTGQPEVSSSADMDWFGSISETTLANSVVFDKWAMRNAISAKSNPSGNVVINAPAMFFGSTYESKTSSMFDVVCAFPTSHGLGIYTRGAGFFRYDFPGNTSSPTSGLLPGEVVYKSNLRFTKTMYVNNVFIAIQSEAGLFTNTVSTLPFVPVNIYMSTDGENWIGGRWGPFTATYSSIPIYFPYLLDCVFSNGRLYLLWVAWQNKQKPYVAGVSYWNAVTSSFAHKYFTLETNSSNISEYSCYTGKLTQIHQPNVTLYPGFISVTDGTAGATTLFSFNEYSATVTTYDFSIVSTGDLRTSFVCNMVEVGVGYYVVFIATGMQDSLHRSYIVLWDGGNNGVEKYNIVQANNSNYLSYIIGRDPTTGFIFGTYQSGSTDVLAYFTPWDFWGGTQTGTLYKTLWWPINAPSLTMNSLFPHQNRIRWIGHFDNININGYYCLFTDGLSSHSSSSCYPLATTQFMKRFPTIPTRDYNHQMHYYERDLLNTTSFSDTISNINSPMELHNNIFFMGVDNECLIYSYMYNEHPERDS